MNTDAGVRRLDVRGTAVRVVRKPIKHLHWASVRRTAGCAWPRRRKPIGADQLISTRGSPAANNLTASGNTRPSISRSL